MKKHTVKIQGLRETPYMVTDELVQWMKLGILVGELEATYKNTKNKEWHKRLKMACSNCRFVLDERINLVDGKQLNSIVRRRNKTEITLTTSDEKRTPAKAEESETITIALEDLYDVADLALNSCLACPQGECVKECFYRSVFHRLGFPVTRENPAQGECEFVAHAIGEVANIKPYNHRVADYYDDNKL